MIRESGSQLIIIIISTIIIIIISTIIITPGVEPF